MYRASRRTSLLARILVLAMLVPIIAACGNQATTPSASPSAASPSAASPSAASPSAASPSAASPSAASPSAASPSAASPSPSATESTAGAAPSPADSPVNDKTIIIGYNQSPETLWRNETSSSIVSQVIVGTGRCYTQIDFAYQSSYCYEDFPTLENGGTVSETVQIDPATISEENPINVGRTLITDTAAAEAQGIEIPEQLSQLRLTYNINPDLRWEDGEAVTAADAIEAFRVAKDPSVQLPVRTGIDRTLSVEEGTNEKQFIVTLVPGFVEFDYYLIWAGGTFTPFLPEHIYGGQSIEDIRAGEEDGPVSFGPYLVSDHLPGEQTTLESNPYFTPQPNIGTVIFKYVANSDQLYAQLEGGEIDVAGSIGLTAANIPQLQSLKDAGTHDFQAPPGAAWEHLDYGIQRADGQASFFDDVRVRQAVAYAINRPELINSVLSGQGAVQNTYVPNDHPSFPGEDRIEPYEFDADRARQLLDEAGWTVGADGIREKDGRRFDIQFYTTEGNRVREQTAQIIQNNLRDVGINMNINFQPSGQLFRVGADGTLYGRRFDLVLYAWVSTPFPGHDLYLSTEIPGPENGFAGQNSPGYNNPEFDRAALAASNEIRQEQKRILDAEPLVIMNRDLPAFALYQRPTIAAFQSGVSGISINQSEQVDFYNIEEIDIAEE